MIQYLKIDANGFYIEPVLFNAGDTIPSDCVLPYTPEQTFYKPKWNGSQWVEGATLDEILKPLKDTKMMQLEANCDQAIVDGFDYTVNNISYRFSCSLAAQANFQGADTLFKDGSITSAEWTVTNNSTGNVERISIDQPTFNALKLQVFQHINSNISKLRNTLQPQVDAAQSVSDLGAIVW